MQYQFYQSNPEMADTVHVHLLCIFFIHSHFQISFILGCIPKSTTSIHLSPYRLLLQWVWHTQRHCRAIASRNFSLSYHGGETPFVATPLEYRYYLNVISVVFLSLRAHSSHKNALIEAVGHCSGLDYLLLPDIQCWVNAVWSTPSIRGILLAKHVSISSIKAWL